jgi:NAD(P)-dependent dehydrogenase (short-subunit alcohol dehydrogenase family)
MGGEHGRSAQEESCAGFRSGIEWPGLGQAIETKRIIETEGGSCEAVAGNVSRADDVVTMVDACIAAFVRVDALCNA